jgi:hypothetical protein
MGAKIHTFLGDPKTYNDYFPICTLTTQIATDKEIDRMVYELYGLTPDEIKVVEGE